MNILAVTDLSKSFGGVKAVDQVSFNLAKGELLALIGPNGAGKTTCFNMLNGQLPSDTGSVIFDGQNISKMRPRDIWRMGVGRTFQITATFTSMTVKENVQMALISHHKKIYNFWKPAGKQYSEEADALLEQVGMQDQGDRACAVLAYGDLKRLELAIALAHKPKLMLMDEPTAGMAPKERVELMELAAGFVRDSGLSILFTEHDMDVVFAHSDRVMVLNRGQIIATGTAEEVRENPMVKEVYLGGGSTFQTDDKEALDA